ncbi:MAG TPA: hypothetical protein PK156_04300 [Polyangium sp.]|nr:hypothetical protein [Polyangium sp.]
MMMSDTLKKFRELTKVFDPIYRPYEDAQDGPGDSYVPEAHKDYRENLVRTLELNDRVKWLVAGQMGCGKTTLLLSAAQHLRAQGRLVVFVNLEKIVRVADLSWIELHVAIIAELLLEADRRAMPVSVPTLERIEKWLAVVFARAQVAPNVQAVIAGLQLFLSTVGKAKDLRDQLREKVKTINDDPLDHLRQLLFDMDAHRPVVIVDGVDKWSPEYARERFLTEGEKQPLEDTPGATVLTIPISLVYEPTFNVLSEHYNNADNAVLPAVRLYDFDGQTRKRQTSEKGLEVLQRVVRARVDPVDPEVVSPLAVRRAIIGSGGNMRELARLLQASVVKAHVREASFVDEEHVAAAIADRRESFRRTLMPEFRPVLEKVQKEYRLDGPGDVTRMLLYGLWVMEYRNGETWYSLPDPVEQLLVSLERRKA